MDGRFPPNFNPSRGGFNPSRGGFDPSRGGFDPSRGGFTPANYGRADLDPFMVNPDGGSGGMFMDPRDLGNPNVITADDRRGQLPRNFPQYPLGPRPEDLLPPGPGSYRPGSGSHHPGPGSLPPGANYLPTSPFDYPPNDRHRDGWTPSRAHPNPDHFRPPQF